MKVHQKNDKLDKQMIPVWCRDKFKDVSKNGSVGLNFGKLEGSPRHVIRREILSASLFIIYNCQS